MSSDRVIFAPMQWLPVPGYSRYEADRDGHVRNKTTKRLLKPYPAKKGPQYRKLRVRLVDDGDRPRTRSVARHILTTFERPPLPGEQARHLNDDPLDNRLDNLAWGSGAQNSNDAKRNGGGMTPFRKITPAQVETIRAAPKGQVAATARALGVHKEAAHKIKRGHRYAPAI